jgi:HprK-related kinase A
MQDLSIQIGPASFRIASAWREPVEQLERLYAAYPKPEGGIADFTVRLEPARPWRRWVRPSVAIGGDYMLPDAAPLPLAQGLLAAEMGMNLQMALGWRRHVLLHASCVERDGRALVMTGASGSGKSTLAAMLGERGWRLMGDEFALLDLASGDIFAFPRLISLKNGAIGVMEGEAEPGRFGPVMRATPKGDIRHLVPRSEAVARMSEGASPAMLLFPRFGHEGAVRPVAKSESFVRLTQASTNYVALGEAGFAALARFVDDVPAHAIDYGSGEEAMTLVDQLWDAAA